MTISRRGLFGVLASLPIVGPAIARQPAPVIDPPLIAVGDALDGPCCLSPGAITWIDLDYDERTGEVLRPIPINFHHHCNREV